MIIRPNSYETKSQKSDSNDVELLMEKECGHGERSNTNRKAGVAERGGATKRSPGSPPLRATLERNGVLYESAPVDSVAVATHEAGHGVAAHAVGRHVVDASIKPEIVLPGEFRWEGRLGQVRNLRGVPQVIYGGMLSEPWMMEEIRAQAQAGLPFTPEQRRWLVEESVITVAGPGAQYIISGACEVGYRYDSERFASIALLLAKTEQRGGRTFPDGKWVDTVQDRAATILQDCWPVVSRFADQLLAVGEMDAEACQALLLSASPCGSHASLLFDL